MTNEGSFIGAQTQIKGNVEADEDLLVMGRVEGDITLGNGALQLEADSSVLGDIHARAVTIRGSVVGNVTAEEMVHISEEGRVVGDLTTGRVTIEDGAQYSGRVEMGPVQTADGERTAPRAAAQPAKAAPRRSRTETPATKPRPKKRPAKAKGAKKVTKERSRKPPKPPTAAGKKVRTRRK